MAAAGKSFRRARALREMEKRELSRKRPTSGQLLSLAVSLAPVVPLVLVFALIPVGNLARAGIYAALLAYSLLARRFVLRDRSLPHILPNDFLSVLAGDSLHKLVLPLYLSLFVLTYFVLYLALGRAPAASAAVQLYLVPVFFLIRLAVAACEEAFFRGVLQNELYSSAGFSEAAAIGVTTAIFGVYFGFSTRFLPYLLPNMILGLAVGAASGYAYSRSRKSAASALGRAIYETLVLVVML